MNIERPYDLRYWTGLWGLSDQELRDAIAAVGDEVSQIVGYLEKSARARAA